MGVDNDNSGQWQNGICGCFSDCKVCILAYIFPPYIIGKNAEALDESCCFIGCMSCLGINYGPVMRWRTRQLKGVEGTMCSDLMYYMFCPFCAIIQEANELGWNSGGQSMARD